DSALRLNQRSPQIWQDERELHRLCASTGMVLYFASTDRLSSVDRLNTLCRQAQVPFLPALIRDDAIEIGPLCVPDRPACWQCLWRRRRAAQGLPAYSVDGQVLGTAEQERRYPGKPAIGVTANILAEAFFTYGTQVEWNTLHESYLILELQHLQNIKHPLFAHPLCTVCSEYPGAADPSRTVTREITHLMRSEDLSQEDLRERMEAWTDEEGGLFSRIEYADYHQLPLTRCQVSVPLACDIPCP